ncbi:hypothetical protein [Acinetobacter lwoffii]|uniref:hypothetical protein n=1 Tax=Acinetobacter lwoffii TaxID=28090 RepID=UPI001C930C4B|nr:hypothetical protein [Acinetobacter lwoffii]
MKGLGKGDRINKRLCLFTFTEESMHMMEAKMLNEIEDFTVEDARGVILVRGGHVLPRRVSYLIVPAGENNVKTGFFASTGSVPHVGKVISGGVAKSARVSSPVTLIGTEALRTFAFDIENVNEAFDKAMKKHVRTA